MLSGATLRAAAIAGTAVLRIVVSNDSIKNATATNHGNNRLAAADGGDEVGEALMEFTVYSSPLLLIRLLPLSWYSGRGIW
jgi:hypothetical protein